MKSNVFERYSSKVKRINIPVPSFDYVHKPWYSISRGSIPPGMLIGRDRIIEKLKGWLTKEKTHGGSYLITGYRGMGKTCYVDRVLYELVREPSFKANMIGYLMFILFISLFYIIKEPCYQIALTSVFFIMVGCIYHHYRLKELYRSYKFRLLTGCKYIYRNKDIRNLWEIGKTFIQLWKELTPKEWNRINNLIYDANVKYKKYSHICINVNLGHEILDEKSVLCVLTSQLYAKYKSHVFSPFSNITAFSIYTVTVCILFAILKNNQNFIKSLLSFLPNDENTCFIASVILSLTIIPIFFLHQLQILRQLNVLRKRINAELVQEAGITFQKEKQSSILSLKETYNYPIASIREIESQLISILDYIEWFPIHPTFYFVFDELDKIETPLQDRQNEMPEFSNEKYLPGGGVSRKRKFTVMHLLANMKYLTSTAKAKFIFIAGREMYDAYLADLTDRESTISSLFNGVIYVESFCKNEKSEKDVMYNAETFISRQLIPTQYVEEKVMNKYIEHKLNKSDYVNIDINLKMYYEYLIANYADAVKNNKQAFNEARVCIDKTIGLLYHFTVYLYHLSNGSPKKMRQTFENFIRPLRNQKEFLLTQGKFTKSDQNPLRKADIDIYISTPCRYLLSFGEKEQRIIGFIHYISFPVNQIITDADQFGDKLLVAASFLINHLYKYHSGGFSWRNIEQTPELLEVYRIPEFRGFINSILSYLTQTHIIQIPCGLYQYKFRKQISEEISLISKVSEEASAIFNFTLDESQSVKQHYIDIQKRHLEILQKEKMDSPHSVAGIHHILADLHMADEEYNNAIFEYQTALRNLQQVNTQTDSQKHTDPHNATFMLAYIRNMLKLGMAFEKRRTHASAYNTYNEIIDHLFQFRELNEKSFGYEYRIMDTTEWPFYDTYINSRKGADPKEVFQAKGSRLISDFSYHMNPKKHAVVQRLAMLEDTRIVYQALLAKLFINEKVELGGITRTNLDIIEGEFLYIHLATNEKEKFLISTDFFRRLGDIMFYKNGLIGFNYNKNGKESFVDSLYYWSFNIKAELHYYCKKKNDFKHFGLLLKEARKLTYENFCKENYQNKQLSAFFKEKYIQTRIKTLPFEKINECNLLREKMWKKNQTMPCYACKFYNRSLRIMTTNLFGIDIETEIQKYQTKSISKTIVLLELIVQGGSARSMRHNHMTQLGEILDCLGNTMLSCSNLKADHIQGDFLAMFLHDVHEINKDLDKVKEKDDFKLLSKQPKNLSKLEVAILYYWEASICFLYGREKKKASGSMKKILRVIQNYLRVSERVNDVKNSSWIEHKVVIGEFINEIKNRLIKQCLINLYAHYNFINIVEIQKLKWIFYTEMYENISLSRLSLFPDVEEIMLIYYELLKLCIIPDGKLKETQSCFTKTREEILKHSRKGIRKIDFTWFTIKERNMDFNYRLIGIYNNISMGSLRHENSIYEKMLALRFKTFLNQYILNLAFPKMKDMTNQTSASVIECGEILYESIEGQKEDSEEQWTNFFPHITFTNNHKIDKLYLLEFLIKDSIYCLTDILKTITPYTSTTLFTHSFMGDIYYNLNQWNTIFDALYIYYKVFDNLDPTPKIGQESYLKRNLFFERYDMDFKCNQQKCPHQECFNGNDEYDYYQEQQKNKSYKKDVQMMWQSRCPHYTYAQCKHKNNDLDKMKQLILVSKLNDQKTEAMKILKNYRNIWKCHNVSDRFFESVLLSINKPNIHYTLTNYSNEMALKSYRMAKEVHREGKAYKEMILKMYYLDDDLKNDTIQFDLAIERFKFNSNYIDKNIEASMKFSTNSIYDIENFCTDNETRQPLYKRFSDMFWNINDCSS